MNRNQNRARNVLGFSLALLVAIALMTKREQTKHQRNLALIAAVQRDDANGVRAALAQGADPDAVDDSHAKPLTLMQMIARWRGRRQWFSAQPTALHLALGFHWHKESNYYLPPQNSAPVVRALLEGGANVRILDPHANSPISIAVDVRDCGAVRLLLAHGADVNQKDQYGRTNLMLAAGNGDTKMMPLLLEHGAQLDTQDEEGNTALIYSIVSQQEPAAHLLLQHHARADIKANNGNTPLMIVQAQAAPKLIALFTRLPAHP